MGGSFTALRRFAVAAAVVCALAAGGVAQARAASEGGPLTQRCRALSELLHGPCRGAEQITSAAAALCRYAGLVPDERCVNPLGPTVIRQEIHTYQQTDLHRELSLQYALGNDLPLRDAPWIGTHNSFNSIAEMGPTLSDLDANQQLSLTDQLRLDVRSLELDAHWFPDLRHGGGHAPLVCHAEGNHAGCSIERPLGDVADEVAAWLRLPANSDQVVLLYLEDHLDNPTGYAAGAQALRGAFGPLLYRPSGHGCQPLPLDLTRDDVLATGAQVIVVSGCGRGAAWPSVAFDWSSHVETRPTHFTDFPRCGHDFDRATYDAQIVRYFEDSTWLTAQVTPLGLASTDDGIQPGTAAKMAHCGVDLVGLDQLLPGDPRLARLDWSWALGQPDAGACAVQRANGSTTTRWFSQLCTAARPAACRTATGTWLVTGAPVTASQAPAACTALSATHAVPRTGYEAQLLRVAMESAGVPEAWLGYRRTGATWTPLDPR